MNPIYTSKDLKHHNRRADGPTERKAAAGAPFCLPRFQGHLLPESKARFSIILRLENAVLADGSATRVDMVICDGCFFEGVPAVMKRKDLTEEDRAKYFGVSPLAWTTFEGDRQEVNAKKRMGK